MGTGSYGNRELWELGVMGTGSYGNWDLWELGVMGTADAGNTHKNLTQFPAIL
jgi:hypothetical protein